MDSLLERSAAVGVEEIVFRIVVQQRREQRQRIVEVPGVEKFFRPFQLAAAGIVQRSKSIGPWFGVGILMLGTIIALLPERALSFATSRVQEGAVTTTLLLLIVFGSSMVTPAHTQHVERPGTVIVAPAIRP